jgi:hypothetical protein
MRRQTASLASMWRSRSSVSVIAIDTDPCRAVIARLAAQLD